MLDSLRSQEPRGKYSVRVTRHSNGPCLYLKLGFEDSCELVVDHWKKLGIKAFIYLAKEEILYPRRLNGEFDVLSFTYASATDPLEAPHHWGMVAPFMPFWHRNAASEGPDWLIEATRLLNEARTTVDQDKIESIMIRIQDLYANNVSAIGLGGVPHVWAVNNRLGNVPEDGTFADTYRGWSRPIFHEQVFIRK